MKRKVVLLVIAMVLVILAVVPASASIVITTNDGAAGVGVSGYVAVGTTSSGYGSFAETQASWFVKNSGITNSATRKGYIRFDVSSVVDTVETASLDLVVATEAITANTTLRVYGLNDDAVLDNWTPSTTKYSNAPGNNTADAAAADLTKATLLNSIVITPSVAAGDVITVSGTNLVNFLNNDTNGKVTFILTRLGTAGGTDLLFYGDGNATKLPTLTVVPEPATIGILLLGGLMGLRLRRK